MIARARRNNGARKRRANAFDSAVGKYIRDCRLTANLSQVALGEGCGVAFQQIQKYEQGIDRITIGRFVRICDTIGLLPAEALAAILDRATP